MSVEYKVWIEIEEIEEDRDHYQTVDTPGGSVATFKSHKEASEFVEVANALLTGAPILTSDGEIAISWSVDDVLEVRPDLNRDQAMEVLRTAEVQHDATIGINWNVLECWAEHLFGHPQQT